MEARGPLDSQQRHQEEVTAETEEQTEPRRPHGDEGSRQKP